MIKLSIQRSLVDRVRRVRTLGGIVTAGIFTALGFAYLTRGSAPDTQTFATLATVQGAFIGIVFSIFVLASQVNATEFSPFTLEQLSKSRTFAGLLSYYTVAILVNILFIQVIPTAATLPLIPDAWTIPFIPQNWNISLGIGAGLTAISLLSLLIARQLLVQLTSPEQLLTQIAQDVTVESLSSASDSKDGSSINRPQRTPLLTIERILESADARSDEYTVQSAIYEMHKAIVDLITTVEFDLSAQVNADEAALSTDGVSILLDRWKTCLEKGEDGPTRRRQFVGQYHRVLLLALMNKGEYELAEKNLEGLTGLCTAAYKNGSTDPTLLLEYEPVFTAAVDMNSASILRQVETELSTISKVILDTINTDSLQDNQRELLSIVLATRAKHIGTVTTADKIDPHIRRNYAETTLDQLNNTLYDCFSLFDGIEAAAATKQNLLTDLHRALVPVIHDCAPADTAITRQLLIAFFELSIKLDRDYSEVIDTLLETGDSNSEIEQQFHDISENSYSPEFTAVNASEAEIESLMMKTKQKYSEYNG